jgi:hypothetical protein
MRFLSHDVGVLRSARLSYASDMLPIRYLSVGGVLLALLALLLGSSIPGATHSRVLYEPAVRSSLMRAEEHPELRQFLILAAARRYEEIERVNTLSGAPRGWRGPMTRFAGLPADRSDADPEDVTGTVQAPGGTLPLEIGETSSTELPVKPEEQPEKKPARAKPPQESKRPAPLGRKAPAKPAETLSFDIFGITRPRGLNDATTNQATGGLFGESQPPRAGRRATGSAAEQSGPSPAY